MQDVSVDDQRARKRMDALAPPSGRLLVVSSSDVTLSERERERAEKSESPISCSQEHSGHADKRRKEGKEDDSAPSPAHRHRHRQRHPPLTDGRSSRSFLRELPHVSTVVEEEEDGMIYTVVLKQAAGSPTTAGASRCRLAKAGTEDKLALHLLRAFALGDASFVSIFLATYRSFSSTQRVLDVLADRLERPPGDGDRSRRGKSFDRAACSVFSAWLSEYPEDFGRLKDPSRLLRLAPLLPRDSPSAADLRARVLRVAEELSEKALLPDAYRDANISGGPSADAREFEATAVLGFPSAVVAEQLTRIETDLFVRVVPYDCLGCVWSQRDKKGHEGACGSVRATVRQFNRLANAVLASCLGSAALRGQQRAKLLEKWIGVAQACRARKNFSSLYAIVSALQSNPIHRLRRTWQDTDREATRRFEELREIFSDKDNYSQSRELLKEEGTSKCANLDDKHTSAWSVGAQGTVPYLGLFLTDLTMLDAAVKDRLENGYVNFDKRRREFEVLAQIRLLQSSCKNCALVPDETFLRWYRGVPTLTQEQSYSLSNEIEAPCDVAPAPRGGGPPTVVITQCPDLGGSASGPPSDADAPFDFSSPVNNLLSKLTKHMRSPSVSCLDVDTSPPPPPVDGSPAPGTPPKSHRRSASCGNNPPPALAAAGGCRSSGPDMRIIRIRMDLHDGNLYRSILVTSDDKTPAAIGSALEKHNQDPAQASAYELLQLLPEGKELLIPATGNVFYAMTSSSVDFLLQRKAGDASLGSPAVGQSESGAAATYPRIKAKGRRLARNLF
ncbi:ral guanine nucleotide dissociation stimulator-like 2 isoform X3 [Phycodurus eques]|uniref:ral guanine nucleotide dissociation stimulator-like 2 isoform X3 n=1 Tax=Phycodurus eques TaxID=693459 RepID=UPI002ACE8470|nr:ral guanine nucleotide dissociation stimulator-like 2 isoform X3 [Phycodurus eques]